MVRRIISKAVTTILKTDIENAAGTLQSCSGVEGGIEAAVHAMQKTFNDDDCEAILLVDATNAFNALNRKAALHNIKELCPPFYNFLNNCYQSPSKLYIIDSSDPDNSQFIYSKEGCTQGDPAAMAKYAIGTKPLLNSLSEVLDSQSKQVWYADDSTVGGRLESMLI